jgi:hypothetical protein
VQDHTSVSFDDPTPDCSTATSCAVASRQVVELSISRGVNTGIESDKVEEANKATGMTIAQYMLSEARVTNRSV